MVGAHDGKGGETLTHHGPRSPKHVTLEELVKELGGDDRDAVGGEPHVCCQEAGADGRADLRDGVVLVAVGHDAPKGGQLGLVVDIAKVEQFLEDCLSPLRAYRDDIVADGEGGLRVAGCLHGVGEGHHTLVEGGVGQGGSSMPKASEKGGGDAPHVSR